MHLKRKVIKIKALNLILPVILILLLAAGCQKTSAVDVITFNSSEYRVLYFPNELNDGKEAYMDAILELKVKYPEAFNEVKSGEKDIDELDYHKKQNEPVLLIKKNGQTIAYLSGEKSKAKIMEHLEMTTK